MGCIPPGFSWAFLSFSLLFPLPLLRRDPSEGGGGGGGGGGWCAYLLQCLTVQPI
ncbi:hypothetical protein BO78DRAFT_400124 [Aspergillus sclerotiicarbonarius CBS 121057]|uniref:Uncharacterized protein n=1 Tax=Aspergillus sclerotiicarbonarius (strain CBS 121057 / IBT 28362) TaxID=1448318 RepID=A0A319EGV4_ASPSB|nr:hypothetical protein BO78DRAFT_400124 [Aspergillus sclerotiicarbonarius CBS 121057]